VHDLERHPVLERFVLGFLVVDEIGHALEHFLEPVQGAHVPVGRRGFRQAEYMGDRAVAQLLEVAEGEHLAVTGEELGQRLLVPPFEAKEQVVIVALVLIGHGYAPFEHNYAPATFVHVLS